VSNFLAIATVTATLQWILSEALAEDVPGAVNDAKATTGLPETPKNDAEGKKGVNIYLYQVIPNAAWRGADLPTRSGDGRLLQRPQLAIDLQYLLTFHGDHKALEPERLLGLTARKLHEQPVLTRQAILDAVEAAEAADPATFLTASDLAQQVELVKFAPLPLNLEELSKLWSVFFQVPYQLSVAYQATVVLIHSDLAPETPVPVRARGVYLLPFRQPIVERVESATGPAEAIVWNSILRVRGQQLRGEATTIRFRGGGPVRPDTLRDRELTVNLAPLDLLAGVQSIQVVQSVQMGDPPMAHRGVESNVAPFVLRPTITAPVTAASGAASGSIDVTVHVRPPIGRRQRVVLLLNELTIPADRPPRAYTFEAPSRDVDGAPETVDSLAITTTAVRPGDYLVRVSIDGAESVPDRDDDPASPTFNQLIPQVTVP
jgi:hypothetical protein